MSNNEGNDTLSLSPVWKSYRTYNIAHCSVDCCFGGLSVIVFSLVYNLQQEAPSAIPVLCTLDLEDIIRPSYFQDEYHGSISNQDTKLLLQKDGQFLVRESGKNREHHTLSLKFNGELKHYR